MRPLLAVPGGLVRVNSRAVGASFVCLCRSRSGGVGQALALQRSRLPRPPTPLRRLPRRSAAGGRRRRLRPPLPPPPPRPRSWASARELSALIGPPRWSRRRARLSLAVSGRILRLDIYLYEEADGPRVVYAERATKAVFPSRSPPAWSGSRPSAEGPHRRADLRLGNGLRLISAQVADDAGGAVRPPRLADIAPVQDQPVMGMPLGPVGTLRLSASSTSSRLARREARAVGDAEEMGVDRDGRLAEGRVEDDVGRLAADPGQRFQRRGRAAPRRRAARSAPESAITFLALV